MKKKLFLSLISLFGIAALSSCSLLGSTKDNDYNKANPDAEVVEITSSISDVKEAVYYSCFGVYNKVSDTSASIGSCVCIKKDSTYSYLITNRHVVEGSNDSDVSNNISVYFGDGYLRSADVLKTTTYAQRKSDEASDLALLRIKTPESYKIEAITMSTSVVSKGADVVAVGCPISLTNFNTITSGVASKVLTTNLIMHTATINPGNSGGGLFNMKGELIGLNVSRTETSASGAMVEDMYYAINVSYIKEVLSGWSFEL